RLGSSLLKSLHFAEAESTLRECLSIRERAFPDDHPLAWLRYNAMSLLGEALLEQRKFAEAQLMLVQGFEKMQPPPGQGTQGRKREALERVIRLYEAWAAD